jgi:hypothetical protein
MRRIIMTSSLLGMLLIMSACVIGPREGYYDRDHQRYYHQNSWHDCGQRDEHCN